MFSKLIKFSFLFFGLVILVLTVSPIFLNKEKIISLVQNKIKDEFNLNLTFDKDIKVSFFPVPKIKIKNIYFRDEKQNIEVKIAEAKLISSWDSLINLKPEFKSVELISPFLKLEKKVSLNNKTILIGDNMNSPLDRFKPLLSKFYNLEIKNGKADFYKFDKFNVFRNFDLSMVNSETIKIDMEFDYENYKSFFKIKTKSTDLENFDYSINQLFENKNEVLSTGNIIYDSKDFNVNGKIYSNRLDLVQISKIFSQINNHQNRKKIIKVNNSIPNVNFDFDLEVDNVVFGKKKFNKISSKLFLKNKEFIVKDLRFNHLKSKIKANASYSFSKKIVNGNVSIFDFIIDEKLTGSSDLNISDASFDCDMVFTFNNKKVLKILDKIFFQGNCHADNAKLVGMSVDKISNSFDNLETFQDFFDLFNKEKMKGETKIDSVDLKFNFKNGTLFLKDFIALQKNIKLEGKGTYDVGINKIKFTSDVFIKTKKLKNLPSFAVLVDGTPEEYKISYNFDEVKSAILTNGVNSILKKKKKIVINPKSFKDLIDEESKEFRPEKIIDLFLN